MHRNLSASENAELMGALLDQVREGLPEILAMFGPTREVLARYRGLA